MISFNDVPSNGRVPFFYAEFDSSQAQQGPSLLPYRVLLVGQKTSAGSAAANSLLKVTSADQVLALAGRGSQLHRMALAYFATNKSVTETWIGVLADNGSGVAATGTITVTGSATAAGTLSLYIGGVLVQVGVSSGDAQNTIATNIAAAINANLDLPVTASAATNVVTLTHRNKGAAGNDTDVRVNYQIGEQTPAGVTVAIVAMASGATNPLLTTLIAALGDTWFHLIANPYTDATSLSALEAELADRFGPLRMIDGVAIAGAAGTYATLTTLGETRNSAHSCIVAQPGQNPLVPPPEFAAALTGVIAYYAPIDPARPLQTLAVQGALAPADVDQFTVQERNLMLWDGIGTTKAVPGGDIQIERIITTYRTNVAGVADASYLDLTTMLNLMYLRYDFRNIWPREYPRNKLAADGTRFGQGQAVITPKIAKARAVRWFREKELQGLVQDADGFKANLVVEINASDPNRLDFLLPPTLIGQFISGAALIQFRL